LLDQQAIELERGLSRRIGGPVSASFSFSTFLEEIELSTVGNVKKAVKLFLEMNEVSGMNRKRATSDTPPCVGSGELGARDN
jgi:hypothetical protein